MSRNLDYIKSDVAKGNDFHLTFFHWTNATSVEIGRGGIPGRNKELGQYRSSVTCALPAYAFERIPAEIIEELDGMGLLKGKDYDTETFVKECDLQMKKGQVTPMPVGSSFAVEWIDLKKQEPENK